MGNTQCGCQMACNRNNAPMPAPVPQVGPPVQGQAHPLPQGGQQQQAAAPQPGGQIPAVQIQQLVPQQAQQQLPAPNQILQPQLIRQFGRTHQTWRIVWSFTVGAVWASRRVDRDTLADFVTTLNGLMRRTPTRHPLRHNLVGQGPLDAVRGAIWSNGGNTSLCVVIRANQLDLLNQFSFKYFLY